MTRKATIENSFISTDCVCGAQMELLTVEPHSLGGIELDVWGFACSECLDQLRMTRTPSSAGGSAFVSAK